MRGPFRSIPRVRLNTSLEPRRGRQRPYPSLPLRSADTLHAADLTSDVLDAELAAIIATPRGPSTVARWAARAAAVWSHACHRVVTPRSLTGGLTMNVRPPPGHQNGGCHLPQPRRGPSQPAATNDACRSARRRHEARPGGQLTHCAETRQGGYPPCRDRCFQRHHRGDRHQARRRTAARPIRPRAEKGDREHRLRIV